MKMCRFLPLAFSLTFLFTATLSETPQQIVRKYQNYHTICSGLGYKDKYCPSKADHTQNNVLRIQSVQRYKHHVQVIMEYCNIMLIWDVDNGEAETIPDIIKLSCVVAFQSLLQKPISNLGNHQTVIFDAVILNEGSGYDVKTGKFTAPEDGVYSFSWNVLVVSGKEFHTQIVKNGNIVAYNYADGNVIKSGSYLASSSTINIKMKQKDQVWIRAHRKHGHYNHGGRWSYFSGFKL